MSCSSGYLAALYSVLFLSPSPPLPLAFHSSEPLNATYHRTLLWIWHLSDACLSFLSQDMRAHGWPINHSAAPSPAELSQSQVSAFHLNVVCERKWICARLDEQARAHVWTWYCFFMQSVCFWATAGSKWGKRKCQPPTATDTISPFSQGLGPISCFPFVVRESVNGACTLPHVQGHLQM